MKLCKNFFFFSYLIYKHITLIPAGEYIPKKRTTLTKIGLIVKIPHEINFFC